MQVENFQKLMDTVAQIDEQGRKAVKATVRDVKARAPSWIAQEVTSVYNIKKFTTISVPSMITSERTNEKILKRLQDETAKRLQHNLDRALGK